MRIVHKPTNVTYSYRLFAPSGKFRTFRIKERSATGKLTGITPEHPRYKDDVRFRSIVTALEALNAAFVKGAVDHGSTRLQVQLLIEQLYRADGVKFRAVTSNGENQSLMEDYWSNVINRRKTKRASKTSARQYLQRVVNALGIVSIRTAPLRELQDALDKAYPDGDQRQRALAMNLNCLLKHAGRHDIKIEPNRLKPPKVKYIEFHELRPILDALDEVKTEQYSVPAFKVMCQMALYTGCRIGELMALKPRDLDIASASIKVMTQIDTDEDEDEPKWGKPRTVAVFAKAVQLYPQWMQLKSEIPHEVRLRAARIFKDACIRAYPKRKDRWLKFHDLRHSFAIRGLEQGLSLELLARQLGNSVRVCEMYYLGFVHSNVTLAQTAKLLNKSG